MLEGAPALASGNVVMWMARAAMKCTRGNTNAGREFVQFLQAVRHQVEPRITVLQDLGVVHIHHLFLSPPGENLAPEDTSKYAQR